MRVVSTLPCPNKSASCTTSLLLFKNILAKKCRKACGCILLRSIPHLSPQSFIIAFNPRLVIPVTSPVFPVCSTYSRTSFCKPLLKNSLRYLLPFPLIVNSPAIISSHVIFRNSDTRAPVVANILMKNSSPDSCVLADIRATCYTPKSREHCPCRGSLGFSVVSTG